MNKQEAIGIGLRQGADFLNQLEGVTSEDLRRAQGNKELCAKIASLLINTQLEEIRAEDKLIHGRFLPPEKQVEMQWNLNKKRGYYALSQRYFDLLGDPPPWPDDEHSAVVLDVGLDTVQQTFEEAWAAVVESQQSCGGGHWRWDDVKSDRGHLRLHHGQDHERALRWRVVDLAANWDKKNGIRPQDVRNANSPHSAILWAAFYFPKWVQQMDGENVPFVWMPAYELNVDGRPIPWTHVPRLSWHCFRREVELNAYFAYDRYKLWAVPSFRECQN